MSNTTILTCKFISANTPDETRNTVQIAASIYAGNDKDGNPDPANFLDITVSCWKGMPTLFHQNLPMTYFRAIGELKVVRENNNDHLELEAQHIEPIVQMPNWQGHELANILTAMPMAYMTATGNVGNVNDRDHIRQVNKSDVCNRSMAVSGNRDRNHTTWMKVDFWRSAASVADQYLSKGTRFAVGGSLKFNTYSTKDGDYRIEPVITSDYMELLGSKRDSAGGSGGSAAVPPPAAAVSPNPSTADIPWD